MEGGAGSFGGLKDSNFEVIWPEIRSTGNTVVAIDYSSATRPNFWTARSVKKTMLESNSAGQSNRRFCNAV